MYTDEPADEVWTPFDQTIGETMVDSPDTTTEDTVETIAGPDHLCPVGLWVGCVRSNLVPEITRRYRRDARRLKHAAGALQIDIRFDDQNLVAQVTSGQYSATYEISTKITRV